MFNTILMMGRRPDSMLGKRKIVIGMLTAGLINKQIVRQFLKSLSVYDIQS